MDHRSGQAINWIKFLGWVLSLAALGFVAKWLWQVDPHIWRELKNLHPGWLGLSLVMFWGWFVTRFLAWRMLSHRHGYQGGFWKNIRMWVLSEFMRYVPGNVWTFLARWRGTRQAGSSRAEAAQALVLEGFGLASGAALLAGLTLRPDWWLIVIGVVAYALLVPRIFPRLLRRWRATQTAPVRTRELLLLTLVYAAAWWLFGLAHAAIYYAFPSPPVVLIIQLAAFSVLAWLLGYISLITPMGLGVREVAFVGLLGSVQVPLSFASLVTVVSRLWLVVSELIFIGLVVWFARKS